MSPLAIGRSPPTNCFQTHAEGPFADRFDYLLQTPPFPAPSHAYQHENAHRPSFSWKPRKFTHDNSGIGNRTAPQPYLEFV
jgi:hypothetical protein